MASAIGKKVSENIVEMMCMCVVDARAVMCAALARARSWIAHGGTCRLSVQVSLQSRLSIDGVIANLVAITLSTFSLGLK